MRAPLLGVLAVLCSFPLFAQSLRHPAPQILVPGAGSVQGANGTFFHSDMTILNYRATSQRVSFQWLPNGGSATPTPAQVITIPAFSGVISEDFVGSNLHISGLGALLVTGVLSDDTTFDAGALLYVTERVWTPQPGSTGTVSQAFPVVATSDLNMTSATILGQRIDSRFRTNVGIDNLDTVDRAFDIIQTTNDPLNPTVTSTVTVPAMSMLQVPLPATSSPALQIAVQPRVAINPALWMAYGSSIDNVTGDSWSSLGFQAR